MYIPLAATWLPVFYMGIFCFLFGVAFFFFYCYDMMGVHRGEMIHHHKSRWYEDDAQYIRIYTIYRRRWWGWILWNTYIHRRYGFHLLLRFPYYYVWVVLFLDFIAHLERFWFYDPSCCIFQKPSSSCLSPLVKEEKKT